MWFGHSLIDELGLLVEVGMSPLAALAAATSDAAAIIGEGGQLGSIATGMRADLVVVAGCPWSKIDDVRRVKLVLQDGVIVHDSPQMDR
jgi:imidazolonepropionase-like amidohydrolase